MHSIEITKRIINLIIKNMKNKKYLIPAGNECLLSSEVEAASFFMQNAIFGKVKLGILCKEENCTEGIIGWGCINGNGASFCPAFSEGPACKSGKFLFHPIQPGETFLYGRIPYTVVQQKQLGQTVRKYEVINHQSLAADISTMLEYPTLDFRLCKVYAIGRKKNFISVLWSGYNAEQHLLLLLPAFEEDRGILGNYTPQELAREVLDVNETFFHHNSGWRVAEDENKQLFFYRTMSV